MAFFTVSPHSSSCDEKFLLPVILTPSPDASCGILTSGVRKLQMATDSIAADPEQHSIAIRPLAISDYTCEKHCPKFE
jgi:hypothetical protein